MSNELLPSSDEANRSLQEAQPRQYNHLNGSTEEILARFCVSELCQGWPVYRDHSEWKNYRDVFTDDAHVFTSTLLSSRSWSRQVPVTDVRFPQLGVEA